MQLGEKKVYQLDEFLFMLGFIPYFILSFLDTSTIHEYVPLYDALQLLWNFTLGIFIIKLLLDRFSMNEIFIYLIAIVTVYASYVSSYGTAIYVMAIFMILSRRVRSELIAKVYFSIFAILFFIIIAAALLNLIPNLIYTRNGLARHAFGIVYPTDFASHVFYLTCGYVFLRKEKYRYYDTLILVVVGVVLYLLTQARLNVACIFILIIGRLLINFDKKDFLIKFSWVTPILSFMVISLLTLFYNSGNIFLKTVNTILSGRLSIVNNIYHDSGLHLLGTPIVQNGWGGTNGQINMKIPGFTYQYIDSAYMRLLLVYGILTTIVVIFLLIYLLFNTRNKYLLLVVVVILISGIVEQHMWEIAYNPFFIILFAEWYRERLNKRSSVNYEIS